MEYVIGSQNNNGSFDITGYDMQMEADAQTKKPVSKNIRLACFYTLAYLKYRDPADVNIEVVKKAVVFIQSQPGIDNFAAAVCAYTGLYVKEILPEVSFGENYLKMLAMKSITDGNTRYWNNTMKSNDKKIETTTSDSVRVLISSYVAMTYDKLNETEEMKPIIKFLMHEQKADGGFGDVYTTAIGMEPLSLMANFYAAKSTNMEIEVWTSDSLEKKTAKLINNNNNNNTALTEKYQNIEIPLNKQNVSVSVKGRGYGFGHVTLFYSYMMIEDQLSDYFFANYTPHIAPISHLKVCVRQKKEDVESEESKVIVMEVNLPSGFIYLPELTNPMKTNSTIKVGFFWIFFMMMD